MNVRKGKERVRTLMCQVLALVIGLSSAGSMLEGFALGQPTLKEIVAGKEPSTNEEVEQDKSKDTKNSTLPIPDDPFGRGTPHGTVEGFLTAAKEGQYEPAAEYLDVRYLPGRIAQIQQPYLARQFEIVLDRALWIDPTDLSIDATGQQEDGLPSYRDSVGHIKVGGQTIHILLQLMPREDGIFIWKFSNATVAQIPGLYQEYGYGYLENIFPDPVFDLKILG